MSYMINRVCNSFSRTFRNGASMMSIIKGNVGTGILAMPAAIMHAGLWVKKGRAYMLLHNKSSFCVLFLLKHISTVTKSSLYIFSLYICICNGLP